MITLYGDDTAINVRKITIALAELGLDYQTKCIDRSRGDQLQESFAEISPNARMPVIKDDASDTTVWESGAILIYLCDRYDESGSLLPRDGAARYAALQATFFQAANIGPTLGRLNSQLTADEDKKIPGMLDIFLAETVRLTEVLDRMLSDERPYLAGAYSIADIMHYPWLKAGLDMKFPALVEKPRLPAWLERISDRPAVQAGMAVKF